MTIATYSTDEPTTTGEEGRVQEGDKVMPFYLVIDTSASMAPDIVQLTEGLRWLQQLILDNPHIADVVHLGVIGFDSIARVLTPLGPFSEADVPQLTAQGGTNYTNAFRKLHEVIDADVPRMRAAGYQVFRACAFFLTDGEPNPSDPDWKAEFTRLFGFDPETGQGNSRYPRFVPFGFRDARLDLLSQIAYPPNEGRAFVQSNGSNVKDAFDAILKSVGNTIIRTGNTVREAARSGDGSGIRHDLPEQIDGMASAPSQYAGGDWMS